MKKVEILAPAGSVESMRAAINAGCDAVYIGGMKFGARAYANNLTEDVLLDAIDYAHVRGKQLYLTVNTLLKQEELEDSLYEYIRKYYEHGLDAVIVQDVGVMRFIHENFPDLPIHASTQMTLTMAQGAEVLKEYGVTRMVTSRELDLKEIKRIRETTSLEIESFVHGALCYCYSGQCFMSSMIGGRSGNRGRCAQPCRMEYRVSEQGKRVSSSEESYILSPKDMCTLSNVADLMDSGIDSFKIEGRMKRYEYSAGVVEAYRREIDRYLELGSIKYREFHKNNPKVLRDEMLRLQDLYNRGGFNQGYYNSHNGKEMMSMHRPNHSGVLVGSVKSKKGIQAEILLKEDVNAQDILEFRNSGEKTYDFTVKDGVGKGHILTTNVKPGSKIEIGDEVYRTKNEALLSELSEKYYDTDKKVLAYGSFYAKVGEPMSFTVWADISSDSLADKTEPITITEYGEIVMEAKNQPMSEENIREKLMKTKDTPFEFDNLTIYLEGNVFLPVSKLNELRRTALIQLEEAMASAFRREVGDHSNNQVDKLSELVDSETMDQIGTIETKNQIGTTETKNQIGTTETRDHIGLITTIRNKNQLSPVLDCPEVQIVYLDLAELSRKELPNLVARCKERGKIVYLLLPHIMRAPTYDEYLKNKELWMVDTIDGYVIKNFEELYLLRTELKTSKEIRLDYNMYVLNHEAEKFYQDLGINNFTASIELNQSELIKLGCKNFDLLVYGYLPLMVSAQCVRKNTTECKPGNLNQPAILEDRMHMKFRVKTNCNYCYNTIYNSKCLSLLSSQSEVLSLAPKSLRLDFTFEDENEVAKVLRQFVRVYCYGESGSLPGEEYSKGHFKRGIL
ncbi:MAG TPA: peptidase U32 [Lachnoclostridium phytofermentans]|uniref:Peptidase U32 n=1 Tax=Lachnoclostridium phytofermentans TaxID=66219 RepID=A0A3D2X7D1_9FIRM|nr:DUF3656 domain-containing protein [Lachnoclostridium sp.]HCL02258.1 peptidase U32 [Lachnoclostridium phytofermentans]